MKPVCYLLNHPRPIGLEPTIYLSKPELGDGCDNPWHPDIIECRSYQEALSRLMHFNITLTLREFEIKP